MEWNFNHEESRGFEAIPEGDYRVRIAEAEKAVSKNGNDMLTLKLDVSGHNSKLFHHIVFLPDRPEITNRMLTAMFASFKDIKEGDLNEQNWIGKVGACHVKHEEYNGDKQAKVHYFIAADKQGSLPPWQEPEKDEVKVDDDGFVEATSDGKLPF
jgi:hypothetical protein